MCVQLTISPEQNLIGLLTPISASYGYQAIHGDIFRWIHWIPTTMDIEKSQKKSMDSTTPKSKDDERSVGIPSKNSSRIEFGSGSQSPEIINQPSFINRMNRTSKSPFSGPKIRFSHSTTGFRSISTPTGWLRWSLVVPVTHRKSNLGLVRVSTGEQRENLCYQEKWLNTGNKQEQWIIWMKSMEDWMVHNGSWWYFFGKSPAMNEWTMDNHGSLE